MDRGMLERACAVPDVLIKILEVHSFIAIIVDCTNNNWCYLRSGSCL